MIDTGRVILCTETEILHLEDRGEFINSIPIPTYHNPQTGQMQPEISKIQCIVPFNRGFIIGGDNGAILAYEKIDDPKVHYKVWDKKLEIKLDLGNNTIQSVPVSSMTLSSTEDSLYIVTSNH